MREKSHRSLSERPSQAGICAFMKRPTACACWSCTIPLTRPIRSWPNSSAIGADPIYVQMCLRQHCFRARVSSKPWRIGIGQHLRPRRLAHQSRPPPRAPPLDRRLRTSRPPLRLLPLPRIPRQPDHPPHRHRRPSHPRRALPGPTPRFPSPDHHDRGGCGSPEANHGLIPA